jgi:hypothetical protein
MSWSDIFPVLTEEMVDEYEAKVTPGERAQYEEWLGVGRKCEGRIVKSERGEPRRIVTATLFWKHVMGADPELPVPTRERLVMAKRMGLVKRFNPWESYTEPLIRWSPQAMERHPGVEFRLYLARDLEFMVEDFTALGWTVYLMKHPSVRYCPGGFWRFLALEERNALVTIIDTDRMNEVDGEIARTELMHERGLGLWRVPGYWGVDNDTAVDRVRYRPILGGHFGAKGGLPIRGLIEAVIWHTEHGTMPQLANLPGRGPLPINYVKWPDYGFDEWFQLAALYPRLVQRGTLSFVPVNARSFLLPVDIEYVTWANRRSEIVYF